MTLKKLSTLVALALIAVGCSGQDVGDANKNPAPGTATRPGAPGTAAPGPGAPQTPQ